MGRNFRCFTEDEMELLKKNPYTYKVNKRQLSFTAEFKNIFWSRYQCGDYIQGIFISLGYDPAIIGYSRMYSVARNLQKAVVAGRPFTNGHSERNQIPVQPSKPTSTPAEDSRTISAMQHEVTYLRQQVEFLKKITELDSNKKRSK